jgi:16S rRNA (guanine527-N7)-methyltransferase
MSLHWELLIQWNARVNLTAVTDPADAAWLHYRDSLAALPYLPDGPIVDLGSGGGFPGIPLAIAQPDRPVTLIEPRRKRASFLEVAAGRLELSSVRIREASHRDDPGEPYAAAVTRATFSSPDDLEACLTWVRPGGVLVAYRSERSGASATEVHSYDLRGDRRVLEVWRKPL